MGNMMSIPKNYQNIADEMNVYQTKWKSRVSMGATKGSQTEVFRKVVSSEKVDFTETFMKENFNEIFTSDKICLPMRGNYNSNHLYRDSQEETMIPIYNDENYTVMHPMGQPGLHLGPNHGSKISHLMIIKHSKEGPITFNEMLPSTEEEVLDLEARLKVLDIAIQNLKNHSPIKNCGSKVIERAKNGWTGAIPLDSQRTEPWEGNIEDMSIREYLVLLIASMPQDIREGRPGYILKDKNDVDVSRDVIDLGQLVDTVFDDDSLKVFKAIQPPSQNSQLLSHIHCFLLPDGEVPECMQDTYYDCNIILDIKNNLKN
jgi:hypothetical protein